LDATAMQRVISPATAALDHIAFARSTGLPASMGKATCVIKCNAPDGVKEDFTRLWRAAGFSSESEFLLDMVLVRCYGRDEVLRMRSKQLLMATGSGLESVENAEGTR
jgi:hypothetical protein